MLLVDLDVLKQMEAVARNALPTDDEAAANAIAHLHSLVEKIIETSLPEWWFE